MARKSSHKAAKKPGNTGLIVILACAALITIGAVLLFFSLFAVYKVYDIGMEITVSDVSAFNTDTDALDFGRTLPGNSNTRTIVMSHEFKRPLLIHFKKSGNISRFVSVPNDFYLEPGISKEIPISVNIPDGNPLAHYEGNLRVYFRRI